MLVHQQPHQFGDGDGRVGVVELDGELLVEMLPAGFFWSAWMRIMSCSEQETKKYCCFRRSSLPLRGSSLG